jgi:hypothetical protein
MENAVEHRGIPQSRAIDSSALEHSDLPRQLSNDEGASPSENKYLHAGGLCLISYRWKWHFVADHSSPGVRAGYVLWRVIARPSLPERIATRGFGWGL